MTKYFNFQAICAGGHKQFFTCEAADFEAAMVQVQNWFQDSGVWKLYDRPFGRLILVNFKQVSVVRYLDSQDA